MFESGQLNNHFICYFFECDKALNIVFEFSDLIISIVHVFVIYSWNAIKWMMRPRSAVANVQDYDIFVNKFELQ